MNISLTIKNNLNLDRYSKMDFEEFLMNIFSFTLKLEGKALNFDYILKKFEENKENSKDLKKLTNLMVFIQFLKYINIDMNVLSNKLLELFKRNSKERIKDNWTKGVFLMGLKFLNESFYKDILQYVKLDNFRIRFLIAKYKVGFILDINTNGLTKTIYDLYLKEKKSK